MKTTCCSLLMPSWDHSKLRISVLHGDQISAGKAMEEIGAQMAPLCEVVSGYGLTREYLVASLALSLTWSRAAWCRFKGGRYWHLACASQPLCFCSSPFRYQELKLYNVAFGPLPPFLPLNSFSKDFKPPCPLAPPTPFCLICQDQKFVERRNKQFFGGQGGFRLNLMLLTDYF